MTDAPAFHVVDLDALADDDTCGCESCRVTTTA